MVNFFNTFIYRHFKSEDQKLIGSSLWVKRYFNQISICKNKVSWILLIPFLRSNLSQYCDDLKLGASVWSLECSYIALCMCKLDSWYATNTNKIRVRATFICHFTKHTVQKSTKSFILTVCRMLTTVSKKIITMWVLSI